MFSITITTLLCFVGIFWLFLVVFGFYCNKYVLIEMFDEVFAMNH